jgi:sulfur-oxidizing protein SoxY
LVILPKQHKLGGLRVLKRTLVGSHFYVEETGNMTSRREILKQGAVVAVMLGSTGLFPQYAMAAFNKVAFDAKSLADAYKGLGIGLPVLNPGVVLQAPDIAENGAVVPVGAMISLPGVKQVLFLVEKNPLVLIAVFNLTESVEAAILTRTKMAQSSDVYAVAVMNDGKVLYAKKEVKVTLGGCGG